MRNDGKNAGDWLEKGGEKRKADTAVEDIDDRVNEPGSASGANLLTLGFPEEVLQKKLLLLMQQPRLIFRR